MRKLFTLMACAALTASSAFADIKIGETTYSTLKDAVAAVADGQTILISGEATCSDRAITTKDNISFTIEGEGTDAVVSCTKQNAAPRFSSAIRVAPL